MYGLCNMDKCFKYTNNLRLKRVSMLHVKNALHLLEMPLELTLLVHCAKKRTFTTTAQRDSLSDPVNLEILLIVIL